MMKLRYRPLSDVIVEYDRPLFHGDLESGAFDQIDSIWDERISLLRQHPSHGKVSGRLLRSVALCSFYTTVTEREVVRAADGVGCVVATMAEMMAFVRVYPREMLHGPILALGSSVIDGEGELFSPMLTKGVEGERVLTRMNPGQPFSPQYRFLLVRATIPMAQFASL